MPTDFVKALVTGEHPTYARRKAAWARDEARYRGGEHVMHELEPFAWEQAEASTLGSLVASRSTAGMSEEQATAQLAAQLALLTGRGGVATLTHIERRRLTATYLSWPQRMAERFVGRLAADAPAPGTGYTFGDLGTVRPDDAREGAPSRAELFWDDCDGQGTPFVSWSSSVQRWAMVTGHRWTGVAAPPQASRTLQDEIEGVRPYLVHYSPLDVPNWTMGPSGRPDFLVLRLMRRRLVDEDGTYRGDEMEHYRLLYVRGGFDLLGSEYAQGGWWRFTDEGEDDNARHGPPSGPLPTIDGVIPYTPYFYERDERDVSRSGTSEIGAVAVSYMNISSAGDHDAIAGGGRTLYMLGISPSAFKEVSRQIEQGSRLVPVLAEEFGDKATTPSIYDSAAASASEAVETALERKTKEAVQIAQDELTRSPDASGKARQVEFQGSQVPRLALMAYNRGAAEQQILRHYQRVHGMTPDATARWKSRYDLETTSEDWLAILDGAAKTNLSSPTLAFEALRGMAKDRGLDIEASVWTTIAAEFEAANTQETQGGALDAGRDAPFPSV